MTTCGGRVAQLASQARGLFLDIDDGLPAEEIGLDTVSGRGVIYGAVVRCGPCRTHRKRRGF